MWPTDTPWQWGATHPGVITDNAELKEDLQSYAPDKNSGKQTKQGDIYDMFSVAPKDFKDTTPEGLHGVVQRREAPTNVGVALVLYNKKDSRGNTTFTWIGVKPPSGVTETK